MGLFWLERQWIFAHRHIKIGRQEDCSMFYSVEPYRKKNYKLYEFEPDSQCTRSDTELISVRHLEIESEHAIVNCTIRFPYISKITLKCPNRHKALPSFIFIKHFNRM
ncbi:unnamed protein product, partial [Rotaria sp. Silwood2]